MRWPFLVSLGGVWTLMILVGVSPAWAGTSPSLRFDPFRPRVESADIGGRRGQKGPKDSFRPVLLSTVVGGERPLANLGGEILSVGEEARGYRLLDVRIFEATFVKDGETIRLEVLSGERESR